MNYKRLLNITLVIILSSYAYSSEEVSIVGVVIDSKGKPVKKADVELLTAKKEKVADAVALQSAVIHHTRTQRGQEKIECIQNSQHFVPCGCSSCVK